MNLGKIKIILEVVNGNRDDGGRVQPSRLSMVQPRLRIKGSPLHCAKLAIAGNVGGGGCFLKSPETRAESDGAKFTIL